VPLCHAAHSHGRGPGQSPLLQRSVRWGAGAPQLSPPWLCAAASVQAPSFWMADPQVFIQVTVFIDTSCNLYF